MLILTLRGGTSYYSITENLVFGLINSIQLRFVGFNGKIGVGQGSGGEEMSS